MKQIIRGMVLASLCVLASCGKGDKDKNKTGATNAAGDSLPRQGACDTRAQNNMCAEYFGQPGGKPGITEQAKSQCATVGGTVVVSRPTEGALGRCKSDEIRIQQLLLYPPMTPEKAQVWCKGMGDGKLGPV